MDIQKIIIAIQNERVLITDHADEEAEADGLKIDEVYFSVEHGNVIEKYTEDKPYPSCLIYGLTFAGDPIHSVWAYNPKSHWAILITVYRPDPKRWINWRRRRKKI